MKNFAKPMIKAMNHPTFGRVWITGLSFANGNEQWDKGNPLTNKARASRSAAFWAYEHNQYVMTHGA